MLFFIFFIARLVSVLDGRSDIERWFQARHIIEEAAKCPHIDFKVKRLAFQDLGAGVERCTNLANLQGHAATHNAFGYSQVSDLHSNITCFFNSYLNRVVLHHQYILRLYVPMHDLLPMQVGQACAHLLTYFPDYVLRDKSLHFILHGGRD